MKKILNVLKIYGYLTGFLILIAILLNKIIGKYFFLFLKTESLVKANLPFHQVRRNIIQLQYKNLSICCRKFSSDIDVFKQIFFDNEFNDLHELILNQKIEIKTILDLGGNIGISSLWFNSTYKNPQIFIVEPDVDNFRILEENLKLNKVNSTNINKGIWKDSRKLYFDRTFRDAQSWSIALTEKPISKEYINSISIDDLVKQYQITKIDLLKIDIEGGEVSVFDNEGEGLNFLKITKVIAIEIHKEFDIKDKIIKTLTLQNFAFYKSGEYFIGVNKNL
jgi:FkbM family methyltransferase